MTLSFHYTPSSPSPFPFSLNSKSLLHPLLLRRLSYFHLFPSFFLSFLLLFSLFIILSHSPSFSFSLSSFSSFLIFFSLSTLLRSLNKNNPAYCSENLSLFALTRTSLATSSSFSFTSTGLIYTPVFFPQPDQLILLDVHYIFPLLQIFFCKLLRLHYTCLLLVLLLILGVCGRLYITTFFYLCTLSICFSILASII